MIMPSLSALALCLLAGVPQPLYGYETLEAEILDEGCVGDIPSVPGDAPRLVFDRPADDVAGFGHLRASTEGLPEDLSATGLGLLRASGSGQFTATGLAFLMEAVQRQGAPAPRDITVIDLRNEPHGHVGQQAVSWHAWNNWLGKASPPAEAWADEVRRLRQLQAQTGTWVDAYRVCKGFTPAGRKVASYHADRLRITTTASEQWVTQAAGMQYLRFPMADHTGAPVESVVEAFIEAVARRSPQSWWHFHCRKGKGRTTLFMAMLDMIYNARDLPLCVIAKRQAALNGVDILAHSRHSPDKTRERRAFAEAFYAYCHAGMPGRWSAWLRPLHRDPG